MHAIPRGKGRIPVVCLVAVCLLASWSFQPLPARAQGAGQAAAANPAAQAAALRAALGKLRLKMGGLLRSGDVSSDQQSAAEFFELRVQMLISDGFRTELPTVRKDIMTELRIAHLAPVKKAIAEMNSFYLQRFQEIAFDPDPNKYFPAARHNAMLMIGDLDQQQFDFTGRTPPVPLPAAVPVMLNAVTDPAIHDVVRAAALVGLVRHARLGIADKQTAEKDVLSEMIKLLAQKQEPVTRSASAHRFFRKRAAEIIGLLGRPGIGAGGKEGLAALEAVVNDDQEPLVFRCEVARNLGQFNYPAPGADPALVGTLGGLAVDITKEELTGRGMRHYLFCLHTALSGPEGQPTGQPRKGITETLPAATKKTATELAIKLTELATLIEKVQQLGGSRQILASTVEAEGEKLKQWLATNQVAAG